MFSDKNANEFPEIGFQSSWKKTKSVASSSCQTHPVEQTEHETQSTYVEEMGTQTIQHSSKSGISSDEKDYYLKDPKFYKFLNKASKLLDTEVERVLRSRAFIGVQHFDDSDDEKAIRKLHMLDATSSTINAKENKRNEESSKQYNMGGGISSPDIASMRVSGLTWNSSGSTIAVVYEMDRHEDWCDHETLINIWNINRRDFDPSQPQQQIHASNCICLVKFHPKDPALLLTGGFTGEVAVYNIARENDYLLASSYGMTAMTGHREKISSLSWISTSDIRDNYSTNIQSHLILSAALDGKIIVWKLDYNKQELVATKGFQLSPDHFPRSLGVKSRSNTEVGITSLSVNYEDVNVFIIGTEPGAIFQGSLASVSLITSASVDSFSETEGGGEWYDPVVATFASHIGGRIIDIRFSPFHRDIFLSAGSDQEIRIYSLLHPHAPVQVIHVDQTGISCVSWSLSRPLVLVASGQNNKLYFHDLSKKEDRNPLEVKASEKLIPFPLTFVEFNGSNSSLVATGDGFGRVHVLKLPGELISMDHNEIKLLDDLSQVPEEIE